MLRSGERLVLRGYRRERLESTLNNDKQYTIYLAGPMTNIAKFNFPAFHDATDYLRSNGWRVLSPAEKDLDQIPLERMVTIPGYAEGDIVKYCANCEFTMANVMEWDLPAIMQSDGIVLLEGWEKSTGARYERMVAEALARDIWLMTGINEHSGYTLTRDPDPTRLTTFLRGFGV